MFTIRSQSDSFPAWSRDAVRKIIHVDMDAFFSSGEQRDDPSLRGRSVAVGYLRARGVVTAACHEARTFGVRSALPSVTALRRCPDLLFLPARFDVYREVSRQIHAVFERYTDLIEPLSLDESYLTSRSTDAAWRRLVTHIITDRVVDYTDMPRSIGGMSFPHRPGPCDGATRGSEPDPRFAKWPKPHEGYYLRSTPGSTLRMGYRSRRMTFGASKTRWADGR